VRLLAVFRPLAAVLVALAVLLVFWWARSPEAMRVKVGESAADLELKALERPQRQRLSDFRGHPVLLVMLHSGSPACEQAASQVERLHREFLQRGLRVVGVSVDTDPGAISQLARRHQLTFMLFDDRGGAAVAAAYGARTFPQAYLIDSRGIVDAAYVGSADWRGEVRQRIVRLLPAGARR
jgi:peroxiredoxin